MPSATGKILGARPHNGKSQSHTKGRPPPSPAAVLPSPNAAQQRLSLLEPTPRSIQQALLDCFTNAFPAELDPNTVDHVLQPLLQQVKHHLYERDFNTAFSRPEWLRAYAARWSASRALGYLDIFRDILPLLVSANNATPDPTPLKISCLGGGAGAEVAALAAWRSLSNIVIQTALSVEAFDVADWSSVLHDLREALSFPQELSGVKEAHFSVASLTADVLEPSFLEQDKPATHTIASSRLVTLMFTLNELYSTSISKTQKLLLDLTRLMPRGSLLLVVDSPGSYSTVGLGNGSRKEDSGAGDAPKQRKYPMSWLLDHALLETARDLEPETKGRASEGPWEKLEAVESRWFRLSEGLRYPVQLENMRYQLHLYRRCLR